MPIRDLIDLGRKLEEAGEKIARLESVEQAIGETEARLAAARAQEARLEREASQARVARNEEMLGAQVQAEAILAAAVSESARVRQKATDWCAAERQAALADVERLSDEANERRAEIATLEDEESRLAQSVTALKAELEAIKSRLG